MTLVAMEKCLFDSLNDERLGWECMEPTFRQIRGEEPIVKNQVITRLTAGQRALCMFRVLYDHSKNSASEYYAWISYLLEQPGYWSGVTGGLHFFEDQPMSQLLQETKEALEARNHRLGLQWSDAGLMDLDRDNELHGMVSRLFERFEEIAPHSLAVVAAYIRSHPGEFVGTT